VPRAVLALEDGTTMVGESFGAVGETFGEVVFSTGMTGYQETLTDPSYHRQVVVQTFPHIGNTGVNEEDPESARIWVAGYVVRDPAPRPSSWRASGGLREALVRDGVVGISGVDTRALTRRIREHGAMRVGVSTEVSDPTDLVDAVRRSPGMLGANLTADVTTPDAYVVDPEQGTEPRYTVAALDLGIKRMTPRRMAQRGIRVVVLPASTTAEHVRDLAPDGVFLSNGPGDPATADVVVDTVRTLLAEEIPLFGICFGNQILGRALGLPTYKLRYGHRGINLPVQDRVPGLRHGKVEITAHNHGFAVQAPESPLTTDLGTTTVSHVCLNDDVVEGLQLTGSDGRVKAFSVQYHPEAAGGPHDAEYLFDRFVDLMDSSSRRTR
jgi:carbamoyl-phosphate synthase small subunit